MITDDITPFFPLVARTRESAAYELAIAFDATEYLSNKSKVVRYGTCTEIGFIQNIVSKIWMSLMNVNSSVINLDISYVKADK